MQLEVLRPDGTTVPGCGTTSGNFTCVLDAAGTHTVLAYDYAVRNTTGSYTLTVQRLIGFGALTEEVAQALKAFVASKLNVLIAGGTGSGKTSMLNALSSFIPEGEQAPPDSV